MDSSIISEIERIQKLNKRIQIPKDLENQIALCSLIQRQMKPILSIQLMAKSPFYNINTEETPVITIERCYVCGR